MNNLTAAMRLLKSGKPVFPVIRATKKPYVSWKEYQNRLPTEEEVKAWWTKWPDANIGMATGHLSGLIVVDPDSQEATQDFIETYPEAKVTRQAQTGREGARHFYFINEPGITNDAGKLLGSGIDVRGEGGYVVLPPSIHANGKPYRWLNKNKPLPLPFKLKEILVNRSKDGKPSNGGLAQPVGEKISDHQRNVTLTSLAGTMRRRGMSERAILAALRVENASKCAPPIEESEVEAIAKSVAKYPPSGNREHLSSISTREKVLGVPIDVEEEEESESISSPKFPEAAWTGLFGQWRDIVAPCTEAALEYLWAAFLLTTGLALGRNVWIENPRPLYLNFYLLLLGRSGDSRKSTVLWFAAELLRQIGEDVEILTGIVSTEGLFERLAKAEETKALGYADEFRALLSVAKRKGTQDILPKLNSLYYCPEREGIDRREKSTVVIRPFFSLITATPQEYVEDLLGNLEVAGGTINRFLIVSGDEQPPKAIVTPPSLNAWESIATPIRSIQDRWASSPRLMVLHPEAKELWKEFYVQWKTMRKGWNTRDASLSARTSEHILKISLLYSAYSGEETIGVKSLATAIAIGEWLEKTTLSLFRHIGLDPHSRAERIILEILKPKGSMYRRKLQQAAYKKKIGSKIFSDALKTLEANNFIILGTDTALSGQSRPVVKYVHGNTQHLSVSGTREKVFPVPAPLAQEE